MQTEIKAEGEAIHVVSFEILYHNSLNLLLWKMQIHTSKDDS